MFARIAILLGVLMTVSGCGYTSMLAPQARERAGAVSGETKEVAARRTRVAVVAIRNDSPEPSLDRVVTDALRRELGLRGGFRLVNDPARADLVLRGRIQPLETFSNSFSTFVSAVEYRVTLTLDLEVVRSSGDVIRLPGRGLAENDVYLASSDVEITRTNRLEALRYLSDLLATRAADSLEWIARPELSSVSSPGSTSDEAGR